MTARWMRVYKDPRLPASVGTPLRHTFSRFRLKLGTLPYLVAHFNDDE